MLPALKHSSVLQSSAHDKDGRGGEAERGRERGREGDGRVCEPVGGFGGAVALQHLKA